MANSTTVLQPSADGTYALNSVARADIARIDISDVDLLVTTKGGDRYLLPGGAISAMGDHPPSAHFSDGTISVDQLLSETGPALELATEVPMPSSLKQDAAKEGAKGKDQDLAQHVQKLEHQSHDQQQKIQQQQQQIQKLEQQHKHDTACGPDDQKGGDQKDADCAPKKPDNPNVGSLAIDTEGTVEQMVVAAQQIQNDLHKSDYDYVPPQQYAPISLPPQPPPGVPPPISLTPIVTLFMGNVVVDATATEQTIGGVEYFNGGGGAANTGAGADIGPRDALQWSAATITGDNNTDVIYADGSAQLGNSFSPTNNAAIAGSTLNYAKEFILNVAGYFTTLNSIIFKDVPAGVSIVGATNEGGGVWSLPSSYVLKQNDFQIQYSTSNYVPGGNNIFTIEVDVTGTSTHGATFSSVNTYEFEYMPVTNVSQITNPTLVYDAGGYSKEIYVLPTLMQPNDITAGDGNDTVYGSPSNDIISLGNGADAVIEGSGADIISVGNGADTITIQGGTNSTDVITVGMDNTDVNSSTVYIDSASGSTGNYDITFYGTGTQTVTSDTGYAGDGNYNIVMNGTGALDITIGVGADTITTYGNSATITAGGGTDGNAHTVYVNSASGNTGAYNIALTGTGAQTVAYQNGYAGDGDYTISMPGVGNDTVLIGNSTSTGNGTTTFDTSITVGNGTDSITTGSGTHKIIVGSGADTIAVGNGSNTITTQGGGGSITAGSSNANTGNQLIQIESATGSTNLYAITTTGSGTTTINDGTANVGGDDNYNITTGTGADAIYTGAGNDTITTSGGGGTITTGLGVDTITTTAGTGNYTINLAGGGGTISTGQGNQTININSASGSTKNYLITTLANSTGSTTITAGDNNYTIIVGNSGANNISIGSGTSNITATTGTGLASITTGNGIITVAVGAGAGDNVTIGSGTTVGNTITASLGNGAGDHITTYGSNTGRGTVAIGSGNNDVVNVGGGNLTVTVGSVINSSLSATNTLNLTSGTGDNITLGSGVDTLYLGSSSGGINTVTLGNGSNTVYVGTGTNMLTGGGNVDKLNFSNLTSSLTISYGTTGTSTATGTNTSDSFTNFNFIYGTNNGDTITLNTGSLNVYAGSGNDTITLGSGIDNVYAGNGNNTITGTSLITNTGDKLYGGTGNNTYLNPNGGTTYNATYNSATGANAPLTIDSTANNVYTLTNTVATNPFVVGSTASVTTPVTLFTSTNIATGDITIITYTYNGSAATVNFGMMEQINEINYASTSTTALTVNLSSGQGAGGNAANSIYGFVTSMTGYSTIDAIIANNGADSLTPSEQDTLLIGGIGNNFQFNDTGTLASQTVIMVGGGSLVTGGASYYPLYGGVDYTMGAAKEIVVAAGASHLNDVSYSGATAGAVINFDDVSHTFSNSVFTTVLTVAAYSGANWGADANGTTSGTTGSNANSWSTGDYFVPVNGTSTNVNLLFGAASYINLVYGGTNMLEYLASQNGNFFYAGSGGSIYDMNSGNSVAVVLTASANTPTDTDIFANASNASNTTFTILNKALDTGGVKTIDSAVSTTYEGTTYSGFAWLGTGSIAPANGITYISGYENILGGNASDYIVGDNNGNQINGSGGNNTIILGDGTNVVTAIQGSNNITSSTASGQFIGANTLNFETISTSDGYNGSAALGQYSAGFQTTPTNTQVEVFLNYASATQSSFFSTGGDAIAFIGANSPSNEVRTGTSSSGYSYSSVGDNTSGTPTQFGVFSTINGSDYSSAAAFTTKAATAAATPVDNSFTFDNVYSGAQNIIGHAGNDVFIDSNGSTTAGTINETFNGSADKSNIYYITGAEIANVSITGGGTSVIDALRIEGAASTDIATLTSTVTAHPTEYTGIDVLDLRSGIDSVSGTAVTMGANTSTATTTAFTVTAGLIDGLVNNGNSSTLVLQLDKNETINVAASTPAGGTITDVHSTTLYYGDVYTFKNSGGTTIATLDVHYGTG